MGLIIKQSFWGTIIAYTGVIAGYVSTLYFSAVYFTTEQIGLFGLVTSNAMIISPVSSLGAGSSYMRFFPSFTQEHKNRFFTFLFIVAVIGNVVFLSLGFVFADSITERYLEESPAYVDFLFVSGMIMVANSLFEFFFSYSRSVFQIIIPSFLRDVYLRCGSMLMIIGYGFRWWTFEHAVIGLGLVYLSASLLLFIILMFFYGFKFDFNLKIIDHQWKKQLIKFSTYAMALAGSFALINNISYDQISASLGLGMNGIFKICFFIGVVVEMPKRNMAKVLMPIISKAFKENDHSTIENTYKRGSITMSVIGFLFMIGIITNLEDLFAFIPKGSDFQLGFWVVIFVCLAKVALMVSSFAGEIINFSSKYHYNLIFQVLAACLLITLNYFIIPIWGINGAGLSYMISIFFHIILKALFVKKQLGIFPFTKSHTRLFLLSGLVFIGALWFETPLPPIISISVRSILTTLVFLYLIYTFKISEDINKLIHSTFERYLKIKLTK